MHPFTRQQLTGGTKYGSKCMIGNWNEDWERQDGVIRDVLTKHATGTLRLDSHNTKLARSLCAVDIKPRGDDGYVRLGEQVQMVHMASRSVLASDVDLDMGECTVTATDKFESKAPCPRSTFVLQAYNPRKPNAYDSRAPEDQVLRYGSKVRIYLNNMVKGDDFDPSGGREPLMLCSAPQAGGRIARGSKHQLVTVTGIERYDSVWQVVHPVALKRLASEGLPVLAGAPIALIHSATNMPLHVEQAHMMLTDFGHEFEVTAFIARSKGVVESLGEDWQGLDLHEGNHFVLVNRDMSEPDGPDASEREAAPARAVPDHEGQEATPAPPPVEDGAPEVPPPPAVHPAIQRMDELD